MTEQHIKNHLPAVTKRADLESLVPGDSFQLSFSYQDRMGQFVTYEGVIDGKIAVMIQDHEDPRRIVSVRIDPNNIYFSGERYKGCAEALVQRVEKEDVVFYEPDSPGFQDKVELFNLTLRWVDPEKFYEYDDAD